LPIYLSSSQVVIFVGGAFLCVAIQGEASETSERETKTRDQNTDALSFFLSPF
jgi:hypothetical protein